MPAAVVGGGVVAEAAVDDPESVCLSAQTSGWRSSLWLCSYKAGHRGVHQPPHPRQCETAHSSQVVTGEGWGCLHLWFVSTAATTRFDELTAAVVQQITEKEPGT